MIKVVKGTIFLKQVFDDMRWHSSSCVRDRYFDEIIIFILHHKFNCNRSFKGVLGVAQHKIRLTFRTFNKQFDGWRISEGDEIGLRHISAGREASVGDTLRALLNKLIMICCSLCLSVQIINLLSGIPSSLKRIWMFFSCPCYKNNSRRSSTSPDRSNIVLLSLSLDCLICEKSKMSKIRFCSKNEFL